MGPSTICEKTQSRQRVLGGAVHTGSGSGAGATGATARSFKMFKRAMVASFLSTEYREPEYCDISRGTCGNGGTALSYAPVGAVGVEPTTSACAALYEVAFAFTTGDRTVSVSILHFQLSESGVDDFGFGRFFSVADIDFESG